MTFTRTLAAELTGTPVRAQVVCPGLTATEFHLGAGDTPVSGDRRVHEEGGMPAADVVTASLAALETGEVVCVPGLTDAGAVTRLAEAELDLRGGRDAGWPLATLTESDAEARRRPPADYALSASSPCPWARAQWAQQKNWPPT